ncbi:hypothetical protein ACFL4T_04740 [candidate division KSB1 bacterium]
MRSFFKSLKVFLKRSFSGQIHFSKEFSGKVLLMEEGKRFQVFRDLKVVLNQIPDKSAAVFKVRFKFSGLSLAVNKRMSIFPAPFLMAKPGFRQKIWTVTEEGWFQGIYQWASRESAEKYPESFIFKMMIKRSAEGTLSYDVIPDTILSEYIENLIQ